MIRRPAQNASMVSPATALKLLRDPARIHFACNPFENERWAHADARTTGADRQVVAESFADRTVVDTYAEEVTRIVHLSTAELIPFVQSDQRMLLLLKDISRDEPWDEPTGRTRPIVIPSVLRRCVSNLLADVLDATCDHLLPACAVAYRPGNHDVVAETIIDVASDVHFGGKYFYWKYDLRKAFPSLPWMLVRASLEAIGYQEAFVDVVLALVAAPVVREVTGQFVPVPNDKGCQAGLPESSILLNIVLKPIDEELLRSFPKLTYRRYSDDGVTLGAQRHVVVGAVRRILTWARANGLRLKDTSPDQGAQSLVLDIRAQVLPLLGAEIHADGDIHIRQAKLDRQIRKLTFMIAHTPEVIGDFELIAGTSKYAPGTRGLCSYDRLDFQESFESFFSYAFALNEGDAYIFLDRVRDELRINPQLPPRIYTEHVWVAALGDLGAVQAGGHRNLHRTHPAILKQWFLYTTALKDKKPIDLEEVEGATSESEAVGEERGDSAHGDGESAPGGAGSDVHVADEEERDVDAPFLPYGEEDAGDDAEGPEGPGAESLASSLPGTDDEEGFSDVEEQDSAFLSETERSSRSVWFLSTSLADLSGRAEDVVQELEPPGPCAPDNCLVVHVVATRVARRREDGGTVVGVQEFERQGRASHARLNYCARQHEQSAVLELVAGLREQALRAGYKTVLILLDDAELPKTLLQNHRAFRRPGLFRLVLDLHAPHPLAVVIAGPWKPPPRLAVRVAGECDRRRRALREARPLASGRIRCDVGAHGSAT